MNKPKGNEFIKGEIALRFGKYKVEVLGFTHDKFWYVRNPENGLMGYTRCLEKLKSCENSHKKN